MENGLKVKYANKKKIKLLIETIYIWKWWQMGPSLNVVVYAERSGGWST